MSETPVHYLTVQKSVNETVVARIKELLDMAEKGEITGFAAITINTANEIGECYCGSVNTNIYKTPDPPAVARQEECGGAFRTIGALEALKARIILEKVDMPGGKIG